MGQCRFWIIQKNWAPCRDASERQSWHSSGHCIARPQLTWWLMKVQNEKPEMMDYDVMSVRKPWNWEQIPSRFVLLLVRVIIIITQERTRRLQQTHPKRVKMHLWFDNLNNCIPTDCQWMLWPGRRHVIITSSPLSLTIAVSTSL